MKRRKPQHATTCDCGGPPDVFKDHCWVCNRCLKLEQEYRQAEKEREFRMKNRDLTGHELSPSTDCFKLVEPKWNNNHWRRKLSDTGSTAW